jgi:c-di-GMP-binding flagellar brake protein YcgR
MLLLATMSSGRHFDLRNSVRFPLHLQVTLKTANGEYRATTSDISAGGILFQIESEIEPGSRVEFEIEMPIDVSGVQRPVTVLCAGRVVRCTEESSGCSVAVVIDEYRFKRL